MSERRATHVIVGANLTGGAAATTLRSEGFEGRIVLIGAEPRPPYERPPLSKEFLRGDMAEPDETMLHPRAWYEANDVELRLGERVRRVHPGEREVELEGGERIVYDAVLIATGGRNRRLNVPGQDLEGVHELRTLDDAVGIRAEAVAGRKAAIVGAGFIGSEVAAALRHRGVEVEVIEFGAAPLLRVFGPDVAAVYEGIHRDHGVRYHFGEGVASVEGAGRVEALVTNRGTRVECDFAVVGVGIEPVTEVVDGTDVLIDNGIRVDPFCRTNAAGVYAAGDVANHLHPVFGRSMRVEHYDNALKQGAAAARNMMGLETAFDDPHWFWSEQYEHRVEYLGHAIAWDRLVVRGSLDDRDFVAFYLKEGLVEGVVGLDRGKEVRRSAGLIRARRPVDPERLADPDVDLRVLAAELAGGPGARD